MPVRHRRLDSRLAQPDGELVPGVAGATLPAGSLVKEDSSGLLQQAGDADTVYGILRHSAILNDNVAVQIAGVVRLKTTASPGFTQKMQRVTAAASNKVRLAVTDEPHFGLLMGYDSSEQEALVYLTTDARRYLARGLYDGSGVTYPITTITPGRPLVVSAAGGGKVASPLHIGATGSRPSSPFNGQTYFDSTVGEQLIYDGTRWRSASLHQFVCGRVNGVAAATNDMNLIASNAMSDTTAPFIIDKDARLVGCYFSLKGGTGGIAWTLRLRLDGSGSDSFVGAARTSSTSWQSFAESIDLAVTAGQRLRWLANTGGSTEFLNAEVLTQWVYT